MAEDRLVPRYTDKPPCQKCGDKGWVRVEQKNGDAVTKICDVCLPPKSSNK